MTLTLREGNGNGFVEGTPGERVIERADDISPVLEACLGNGVYALLLYPENLTPHFFDLSSREAGEILQKLRNYRIRLAVLRTPELRLSRQFGELLADGHEDAYFRLFDDRAAAQEWLSS